MLRFFSITLIVVAFTTASLAQEVGRTSVNGREIIILENGTWRYADAPEAGASSIGCENDVAIASKVVPLSLCLAEDNWKRLTTQGDFEQFFSTKDGTLFMGVIPEVVEVAEDQLPEILLQSAQEAAGLHEVVEHKREKQLINGVRWNYMEYQTQVSGIEVIYTNYFKSGQFGTVQIIFWTFPSVAEKTAMIREQVAQSLTLSE